MADFLGEDLLGTRFEQVDIHGELENLTINGLEIAPLLNAELDRRYPDRPKMRPTDPAGFREVWDVVERLCSVWKVIDALTDEEWEHRRYTERDQDALQAHTR